MLELLHIENVAVIEQADIPFGAGLNVLTGETGAGKSIIIDSIGAILGGRVSRELVRTGAPFARITAELTPSAAALNWLSENEFEVTPGENLMVSRRISADGKSTCRVNGAPAASAQLRALGDLLFDVHGQNDGQHLLRESSHRAYLDAFGGLERLRQRYSEQYRMYAETLSALTALEKSEEDKEFLEAKLKKEIRELSSANPKDGEEEELLSRVKKLQSAEKLTDKLTAAYECFYGSDHGEGVIDQLVTAGNATEAAGRIEESYAALAAEISDLRYRAEDIAERIEDARRELDYTPGELDRLQGRLSLLQRLSRKYGSAAAARARLEAAKNELEDVQDMDERIEDLRAALEKNRVRLLKVGKELSEARQQTAGRLEKAVEAELRDLSMAGAKFRVSFTPKSGDGFDAAGLEDIRFLLAANAGQAPGRLSHIASGGELSRIMLAMKNVLRTASDPEVLIFDEIDTGVSGIAAQRVGEKLASLASGRQVLCVTHLPQLAAMADTQFVIRKQTENGNTFTQVLPLDTEGRKRELARLVGGETVTETTLSGAEELIAAADSFKRKYGDKNRELLQRRRGSH